MRDYEQVTLILSALDETHRTKLMAKVITMLEADLQVDDLTIDPPIPKSVKKMMFPRNKQILNPSLIVATAHKIEEYSLTALVARSDPNASVATPTVAAFTVKKAGDNNTHANFNYTIPGNCGEVPFPVSTDDDDDIIPQELMNEFTDLFNDLKITDEARRAGFTAMHQRINDDIEQS